MIEIRRVASFGEPIIIRGNKGTFWNAGYTYFLNLVVVLWVCSLGKTLLSCMLISYLLFCTYVIEKLENSYPQRDKIYLKSKSVLKTGILTKQSLENKGMMQIFKFLFKKKS